jgi:hypothetical protein
VLEILLWTLAVGFVLAGIFGVILYFVARWVFVRAAERMASIIDQRVGGHAAHALTRLARYAQAAGLSVDDAARLFASSVDRLARVMDSAVTLPLVGRVGLDAVIDFVPVVGNFAGAAISLLLIARTLQFGPPPSLVSKMIANVLVDVIVGGIPLIGPLADIWWRANDRNVALMREFLGRSG